MSDVRNLHLCNSALEIFLQNTYVQQNKSLLEQNKILAWQNFWLVHGKSAVLSSMATFNYRTVKCGCVACEENGRTKPQINIFEEDDVFHEYIDCIFEPRWEQFLYDNGFSVSIAPSLNVETYDPLLFPPLDDQFHLTTTFPQYLNVVSDFVLVTFEGNTLYKRWDIWGIGSNLYPLNKFGSEHLQLYKERIIEVKNLTDLLP